MLTKATITDEQYTSRVQREDKSMTFTPGVNVIVGNNGSGKSTIYDLLSDRTSGEKRECLDLETQGLGFTVCRMKMQEQGLATDMQLANGAQFMSGAMARFESHGENLWRSLELCTEFKDGSVIIIDEPEQALDFKNLLKLRDNLLANKHRLQFIIATHNPILMLAADNIISMDKDQTYAEKVIKAYRKELSESA
ncbi:AAA family ATPase [Neptuniibacter sp. QD37_11]|uniref:AAA family ATPase n=1 Tax=Neptuniibacter sp. QD37_11 TaxID=3398209 RepID=UPI0039F62B84